jgi:hypothetical protein
VGIRVGNAYAENAMSVDHCHDFVVRGDDRSALSGKEIRRSGSSDTSAS